MNLEGSSKGRSVTKCSSGDVAFGTFTFFPNKCLPMSFTSRPASFGRRRRPVTVDSWRTKENPPKRVVAVSNMALDDKNYDLNLALDADNARVRLRWS